jgi:hypothetical protein
MVPLPLTVRQSWQASRVGERLSALSGISELEYQLLLAHDLDYLSRDA